MNDERVEFGQITPEAQGPQADAEEERSPAAGEDTKETAKESIKDPPKEHPDYEQELIGIIRSNASPKVLKDRISNFHENDIALALEHLTTEERKKLYRMMDPEMLSDVFEYVEDDRVTYFNELNGRSKVDLISRMDADEAVELLRQLERNEKALLIDLIDDESRRDIALIASFDQDEIGSRMTTNFIRIRLGSTVKEAMHDLVEQAADNDNISTLYVLDENGTFVGAVDLKDLITARQNNKLEDLISTSFPYVYGQERIENCIELLKSYSEDSIPVLDNNNKLLGVITSQDIVEVVDEQMGEDYARLAGLAAEEDLKEPVRESVKKRFPWLMILLCLGLLVSGVVGLFEEVVAQLTIVVFFQSLILDMAGNVGTQSLAVTIRVLTDEQLPRAQKFRLVWKEARIGLVNGLIVGSLSMAVIGLYVWLILKYKITFAYAVSACIGAAMVVAMLISSLAGTGIPMLFKKLKIDPAVASGPLITTLNDLVAVVSYYGLVWLFLIRWLHLAG